MEDEIVNGWQHEFSHVKLGMIMLFSVEFI